MARRRPVARSRRLSPTQRARRRAERRRILVRRLKRFGIGSGIIAAAAALVVLLPLGLSQAARPSLCVEDPSSFPASGVAGWSGEQLENAATIVRTASDLGFGRDGQIIGVMTAMGESSLRNIDYGDWETIRFTNPDGSRTTSVGLFQQQEWWGSFETRMDAAASASLFFDRLARVDGWQQMEPSHAIHRVQINTERDYYAQFQDDATAVVDALSGACPAA